MASELEDPSESAAISFPTGISFLPSVDDRDDDLRLLTTLVRLISTWVITRLRLSGLSSADFRPLLDDDDDEKSFDLDDDLGLFDLGVSSRLLISLMTSLLSNLWLLTAKRRDLARVK